MNETSATSASGASLLPDGIATLTAIHFTIIGVLAILVVIGLLWGIRAKRSRVKASHDVIANAEEAGVPPEPIDAAPAPVPTPAPPPSPAVEERRAEQSQAQSQATTPAPVSPPVSAPVAPPVSPKPPVEPMPAARDAEAVETPDRLGDEPIAAVSPLEASPAIQAAAPAPVEAAPAEPVQSYADGPVTQLKGLGPKVAAQLGELGVSTVGQMAALSEGEAQAIDAQLGNFTGRMGRDRWIEQARLLAAGDKAGFEAVFGKL